MKYVDLVKANIRISKIGLGTNAVGGHNLFTNLDEEQGKLLVREALNQGITFIDTADAYGFGRSEELLGAILKGIRSKVVLATKGGMERLPDGTTGRNNHPVYLRNALESSLKRLQTDYVDIYYIHYPDGKTPLAEAVGELSRLKEEGKIRAIGIANVTLEQLKAANCHDDISVLQSPYNMLDRSAETDLLSYCRERNISFIPYGPLAFGILGGKYDESFRLESKDWRNKLALFKEDVFRSNLRTVCHLKEFAAAKGTSLANLALAWLLQQEGIDAVIPGAKRAEQVAANVQAVEVSLSAAELAAVNAILEA